MKNFNIKSKALSMLVLLLVLLCSAGYSQSGTFGNTYIGNGAEMAIHNVQQNFLNGGSGVLPGIVGTQRTASTGYLSFVGTATSLGAADNAHVDGYAKTYMTAAFTFPIGDNGKYRPAAVSTATLANPANAAYFGVSGTTAITSSISGGNEPVLPSSGPFATTSKDATVNTVDNVEYWDINGATAANITLTWDANSAVASMTSNQLALLKILGWNGTQWVIVPSTYDATSILGGASTLTSGSITTTSTLTPNSYEVYTLGSLKFVTNPDVNQGVINKPIPGNVATNDVAPAGTTYGTPVLGSSPAGSSPTMTMNPDGTYTFQSDKPGVYVYNVPVCVPGQVAPCPTQPLVITVQDPALANNTPVANTDITSTAFNTPVTYPVKANDAAVNPGNTLGNPTITAAPTHGTAVVNGDGTITYTPTAGYVGNDTLTYQVCETPSGICKTAQMIVTVNPSSPVNSTTAADDYNVTTGTAPATGNVKTNDTDPNGNTQTVTPQNITVPGKGTFVLLADGSYTFTPVAGFSGTVDLPYTTCDNGTPQACATATLHIVVKPAPVALKPDVNEGVVNKPIPGSVASNDVVPAGTTYGTPTLGSSPAGSTPTMTMNPDGTYTFQSDKPGVYVYNVPVCVPGQVAPCPTQPLVITVQDPALANNTPVANTDVTSTGFNTPVTYPVKANDAAVNPGNTLGNPTITAAPTHGTAVVNGDGTITYTPTVGYVGNDTLTYQVCETPSGICKTAQMIVTVNPSSPVNSTTAADDYNVTTGTAPATGNVKTNDTDPNGNTQTVTPQNITVPGKGTFVLLADGSYTFTPVAGFSGTVDLPYTTCDNGTPQACATATLHIVVKPAPVALKPDVNEGVVNKPIPGSVASNDVAPAGTTYGTPVLGSSPAGSSPTMTMNPDGTYTFQSDKPGVYVYNVPVCVPGQVAPCPTQPLVITVQDPAVANNTPVANTDVTSTGFNTPVTYPVKANDAAVNPGNTLGNPTITAAPTHGTAVVNGDGTITYTPTAGYVGNDTLTYQVCETPSGICKTAQMIVTVNPSSPVNSTTAADDYNSTTGTTPATGNVKTNDTDPNGNTQTLTPQNITVPGKGTFVLLADGSYTFTPVAGFSGTVDLPYTTCDNGTPQACATATLHIVVKPAPVALNPDVNAGVVNKPIPGSVATNDVVPAGTTYGTPVLGSSPAGSTPTMTMNPDGTYTFQSDKPGVYVYNVPVCVPGQVAPCPTQPLTITVQDPALLTNVPVANPDVTSTAFNTPVTYPVKANDAAVNPGNTLGNPTITAAPTHGTAVVNGDGTITYTPTAGYVGNDTLTYQVCETPSGICTTAKMIVTVNPTNPVNSTTAADDYNSTAGTVPATGSVKTNDTDPNGNTQTVTPQNITVPGKGTFVLLADGTYTFTPQSGFAGTVDLPYTTCDNGTPQACATATLHIVVKSVTVVPIKLLSFVANPKGNTVQLTWVVTTEINVANYEIEYSATGANFTSIGAVTATGSSNYSLVHYAPKQGLNYYRLKIIDKDGKVSYSEVRKVNFGVIEGMVSVYPVPARDVINITLTGNLINQSATIVLFSMDGKLMLKQVTPALSQTETINVSKFASGQYILQIITTTEVVNKKIEIVK